MRVNFNVINQKNVPALQSGLILPAPGQVGRIFYNAAGVGMYIDDGTAWLPITTGGGSTPTLQQVTTEGNQTNNDIILNGSSLFLNDGGTSKSFSGNNLGGPVADYVLQLPDNGGVLPVSVNNQLADSNGNINIAAANYLVYTATITQQGTDDPQSLINTDNGNIIPGVTYQIANYAAGDDFTNIGAPSNSNGVKFVATGATATVWSGATQLNYNNAAPVTTVLQNTIGNIWFDFINDGVYRISSIGLFEAGKSWAICPANTGGRHFTILYPLSINEYIFETTMNNIETNGQLTVSPLEIRVYNVPV